MTTLVARGISFEYRNQRQDRAASIIDVNFEAFPGEVLCLIGKNGSCKSTLAKILCGHLTERDGVAGSVSLGSASLYDGSKVGYLAQDYPLLPWLKVRENLDFPLRMLRRNTELPTWLDEFIASSDLGGQLDNYPSELSGGQRQQAALIQALVLDPELLIMDEPYSALSQKSIMGVKNFIKKLQKRGKIVVQIVHDFGDAIDTSTRILVMNAVCERRFTVVADLSIGSAVQENTLLRQQFANDMATLAFQEAMQPLFQKDVQAMESSFPAGSEVVIVALDPEREFKADAGFSFLPVVAQNLKRGVKYIYAFPGFSEASAGEMPAKSDGSSIDAFVGELLAATSLDRNQLGELLRIYIVTPKAFRSADFVIAAEGDSPIGGWEFPTAHPHIIFETERSKLPQKLKLVRGTFQDAKAARQVFP